MTEEERAAFIAAQNDKFRENFSMPFFNLRGTPGMMVHMRGIAALPPETQLDIWQAVSNVKDSEEGDDPHQEHDFGAVIVQGIDEKVFWKIDYYADVSCTFGSEDPSDSTRCFRVLTIMLASEYWVF